MRWLKTQVVQIVENVREAQGVKAQVQAGLKGSQTGSRRGPRQVGVRRVCPLFPRLHEAKLRNRLQKNAMVGSEVARESGKPGKPGSK
jgi:hypothetical protein